MIADAFREIGILVFVFAILDKMISGTITIGWTIAAIALALGFFGMGLYIERSRTDG